MNQSLTERIKQLIKQIPAGKIATYGQIAIYAGNPRASRQVSWVLHSSSRKENLPWHRVINSKGRISLPKDRGYDLQKKLLEKEGVVFEENDFIDLDKYIWIMVD